MSYGTEISCTKQLVSGRLTTGAMVVVEALYRRLITPRGTLGGGEEESVYGFDVAGYVGAVGTETALLSLPSQVQNELAKDDRVATVLVDAQVADRGDSTYDIVLGITGVLDDETTEFEFSVGVSDVTAEFLGGVTT